MIYDCTCLVGNINSLESDQDRGVCVNQKPPALYRKPEHLSSGYYPHWLRELLNTSQRRECELDNSLSE